MSRGEDVNDTGRRIIGPSHPPWCERSAGHGPWCRSVPTRAHRRNAWHRQVWLALRPWCRRWRRPNLRQPLLLRVLPRWSPSARTAAAAWPPALCRGALPRAGGISLRLLQPVVTRFRRLVPSGRGIGLDEKAMRTAARCDQPRRRHEEADGILFR